MKKFLVLFFTIFYVSNIYANEDSYILVELISPSMIERGYPDNELIAGTIDTINMGLEVKKYSITECLNKTKEGIKFNITFLDAKYYKNGVYYNGGFGRFVCLEYNIINKYITINNKRQIEFFKLEVVDRSDGENVKVYPSQFSKDFPDVVPYTLKEEDIKNYTIFPLMKNQKEAKKLTNKLNEEVNNVLQQLLKK